LYFHRYWSIAIYVLSLNSDPRWQRQPFRRRLGARLKASAMSSGCAQGKGRVRPNRWPEDSWKIAWFLLQTEAVTQNRSLTWTSNAWGKNIYSLEICYGSPWKDSPFLRTVNHLFLWAMAYPWRTVSHNQVGYPLDIPQWPADKRRNPSWATWRITRIQGPPKPWGSCQP
jgi:hypothetical protein